MEEEKSLFLELEGSCRFKKKLGEYEFDLVDHDYSFNCKTINYIADPAYDITFKYLFGREEGKERLKDFINSIIFPNKEDEVIKLTYINNEFHKLNNKKCKGVIRTDIVCEIETSEIKKPFLMSIGIQIGKSGSFSKRVFNYGTSLRNDICFKNCYSIGLDFSIDGQYRSSNYRNLFKTIRKKHKLKYINIIDIDINDEIDKIKNDKSVIINKKEIGNNGKEYIKLLGIRNWCKSDSYKYIVPKISLLSSNKKFLECLEILGSVGQNALSLMKVNEQSFFEEEKEKRDREYILSAFSLFLCKEDPIEYLQKNQVDLGDYTENYIKSVLKDQKFKFVKSFIRILNKNDLLTDSSSSFSD